MSDAIEIGGRPARTLAVTTSIANTGRLEKGVYDVSCTVDVAIAGGSGTLKYQRTGN